MSVVDLNLVEGIGEIQCGSILTFCELVSGGIGMWHWEFPLGGDIIEGSKVYSHTLVSILFANNHNWDGIRRG
jgi:hypothetical protein